MQHISRATVPDMAHDPTPVVPPGMVAADLANLIRQVGVTTIASAIADVGWFSAALDKGWNLTGWAVGQVPGASGAQALTG